MTTTAEILQKARDLISDEKNWTQLSEARDANGHPTLAEGPTACSFCINGALQKVCPDYCGRINARHVLAVEVGYGRSISKFNDTHRHDEVLSLFDRAIKRAISSEKQHD